MHFNKLGIHSAGSGLGANLVGVLSRLLASTAFNENPTLLRIAGVRESHTALFNALRDCMDAVEASSTFERYMNETFKLEQNTQISTTQRRFRASYLRLLRGWGFDANSREGAVLKSWVESRFGIYPTFHKMPLRSFSSDAWANYIEEKMSSRFHNNAIYLQLDLLYEFCQWSLARGGASPRHVTLYRGINDFDEHRVIAAPQHGDGSVLRLNNLVSFSASRIVASEFGDCLLEVQVPSVKVVFHSELLTRHALKGEAEYLAIGGDYHVKTIYLS
ncbi:MAG: NAD(+)--dinitrogen-reductase ADP-D-ribosyltransferase [Pseudomonadota bacterium]